MFRGRGLEAEAARTGDALWPDCLAQLEDRGEVLDEHPTAEQLVADIKPLRPPRLCQCSGMMGGGGWLVSWVGGWGGVP